MPAEDFWTRRGNIQNQNSAELQFPLRPAGGGAGSEWQQQNHLITDARPSDRLSRLECASRWQQRAAMGQTEVFLDPVLVLTRVLILSLKN